MRGRMISTFLISLAVLALPVQSQEVVQSRGVDPEVDYESLKKFGPWDDRNYQLTAADLDVLAPNEEELKDPIPAFFRVEMRRNNPTFPREGPAQYPRSALQNFLQKYNGYLINCKIYQGVKVDQGRYVVVEEGPQRPKSTDQIKNCQRGDSG